MIKRKLTEADWFLILINLLPVYGVWFEGWSAKEVFLVHCLETIIIGLFYSHETGNRHSYPQKRLVGE
jgi:hypothetical protein